MRGVVPATFAVGLVLVLAGCSVSFNQPQAAKSPEASPSAPAVSPLIPAVSTTPSTSPTGESSPPATSPPPGASPSPAKLIITSLPFHAGEVGVGYAPVALGAAGGVPPYRWSISSGALPPGLALSSAGSTTGTPSSAGGFSVVVRLDDAAGGAAGVSRTITVVPHLSVRGLCTNFCDVEQGCASVCGGFGTQSGGLGPYKYKLSAGSLPTGMGLHGLALTGTFQLPAACGANCGSGPIDLTVAVTDGLGATGKVHALFDVFPHIAFTATTATCAGFVLSGCVIQLPYTGGTPNGTPKVNVTQGKPPLPTGSTFIGGKGVVSVSISGPGCGSVYANTGYDAVVTLVLVDQSPCGAGFDCSSGKLSLTIHLLVC